MLLAVSVSVPLAAGWGYAPVGARAGAAPLARHGDFEFRLRVGGETVASGRCSLTVEQRPNGFLIVGRITASRMQLPAGDWQMQMSARSTNAPRGVVGGGSARSVLERAGMVLSTGVVSREAVGRVGPRVACGIRAVRRGRPKVAYRYAYATVAWPSFRALGTNAPIDRKLPNGGLSAP